MNYFFITGTSRGIGKAFAEKLLKDKNNFVYGFSRSNNIDSVNYRHEEFDLSDLSRVKEFVFPELKDAQKIVLVNNSAIIKEVNSMGKLSSGNIIEEFNVNIVSPALLINSFIKKYQSEDCRRIILNISSGAAHKAIESWSIYCAGKSALAMLSEVTDVEQKLKYPDNPINVFSVGPGVVNTQMQTNLRKVSPDDFSMVGVFIEYYEKNELAEPEEIAEKLEKLIHYPEKYDKVALNVKEV